MTQPAERAGVGPSIRRLPVIKLSSTVSTVVAARITNPGRTYTAG